MDFTKTNTNIKDLSKIEELELELGDIIKIFSPTNQLLHNQIFIIDFIDKEDIKLINSKTFQQIHLFNTVPIGDGTIEYIRVISRTDKKGYAKQNDLLPGTWIDIHYEGDIPSESILTGEIKNLEEDMIQVELINGSTIYIDFKYEGIPKDLPIQFIQIREKPQMMTEKMIIQKEIDTLAKRKTEALMDTLEELYEEEENAEKTIDKKIQDKFKQGAKGQIIRADEIQFLDEDIGKIIEYVDVSDKLQRFPIEVQLNDMLNDMLSTVPFIERTHQVLNSIHTMIERYKQLRETFSKFDTFGNVISSLINKATYKPIVQYSNMDRPLYWIYPVVKRKENEYKIHDYMDEYVYEYKKFTYDEIYKNMQNFSPYLDINDEEIQNILYQHPANSNINTIVDNLGNYYSIAIKTYKDKIKRFDDIERRFVNQQFIIPLTRLEASSFIGSKMIADRINLTEPETMNILSIMTLPEPAIHFSKIQLPGSSLLLKANLNQHFMYYFKIFTENTKITENTITDFKYDFEYNERDFAYGIKNFKLELSPNDTDAETMALSQKEKYIKFFETIFPKTRHIFEFMKQYIHDKLSIIDVVSYLEPFLIYTDNLTFNQYLFISRFISEKINEYNSNFVQKQNNFYKLYNEMNYIQKHNFTFINENIFSLIYLLTNENSIRDDTFREYGINLNDGFSPKFKTNSEYLKYILTYDYGYLYNYALSMSNSYLLYNTSLIDEFKSDKKIIDSNIEYASNNDTCGPPYVIAKRYSSIEDLEKDNYTPNPIYFDKSFDTTNYGLFVDYENEMINRSAEDFLDFLIGDLQNKHGLNKDEAEYLAETLIEGHKIVRPGQYAVVYEGDELKYFIRSEENETGIWQDVTSKISNDIQTFDNDLMCNFKDKCISVTSPKPKDSKCESITLNELQLQKSEIDEVMHEFDAKYYKTKNEYDTYINDKYTYYSNIGKRVGFIKELKALKYNNEKYLVGLNIEDVNIMISPYQNLLNLILGQQDIAKKNRDIIRFTKQFTRPAIQELLSASKTSKENESWLYCKETGSQLLPVFKFELASAWIATDWIENPNTYRNTLGLLLKRIGDKSDDGDWWIDKGTGWQIVRIDWDIEEGYEDGFRKQTRDVLEEDIEDIVNNTASKLVTKLSPENQQIMNIINTIASEMGISLDNQKEFIINCVSQQLNKKRKTEAEYRLLEKASAAKNRKLPTFNQYNNAEMIYNSLAMLLIAIQVTTPGIRTRRTFPGCISSFYGYPIEGNGDMSSLMYISCVAYNLRKSVEPWSILKRQNPETIAKNLKNNLETFMTYPEVKYKQNEKLQFLISNPNPNMYEQYSVSKWLTFLPPLVPFKIKSFEPLSTSFKSALMTDLKTGNSKQIEKIGAVQHKIITYSLAIQEAIYKILQNKRLILKNANNVPYLENACCNEKGDENVLQYFIKLDPLIEDYNRQVYELNAYLEDIVSYTKSKILCSKINTKNIYPQIRNQFSKTTIFLSFIHFCKFKSILSIPEELIPICGEKPEGMMNPKLTLIDRIKMLNDQNEGKHYIDNFNTLLQLVGRNNLIQIDFHNKHNLSSKQQLENNLNQLKNKLDSSHPDSLIETKLIELLLNVLDTFEDLGETQISSEIKDLNDYFLIHIQKMREDIFSFVSEYLPKQGKNTNPLVKVVDSFLKNINDWTDNSSRNSDNKISNEDVYNQLKFFKNYISMIVNVFPNMILNNVSRQKIEMPKHWGFSRNHNTKISNQIANFYSKIEVFNKNTQLSKLLIKFKKDAFNLVQLSKQIPTYTTIEYNKTIFVNNNINEKTGKYAFEYLLLKLLMRLIELSSDPEMLVMDIMEPIETDIYTTEYIEDLNTKRIIEYDDETRYENQLYKGNVKELKQLVASYVANIIDIMNHHKIIINFSYQDIQDSIFKLKEGEKNLITERLENLTEEMRNVDTILKINKLGEWGIGLQKSLRQYVANDYDEDKTIQLRNKMDQIEKQIRKNKGLDENEAIDDIERLEALEEMNIDDDINSDNDYIGDLDENYNDGW
jgi:hypothetical protein